MKVNSVTLAVFIVGILFGGIFLSTAMNWWQTESNKTPAVYAEGPVAGEYNPADIRGSYTFGEISDLFEVPLNDLQVAFQVPPDVNPAEHQVKSIEEQFADLPVELGTASIRLFVAFYQGLPYDLSGTEETYLLPEAAEILTAHGKMTTEQSSYLESHIVPVVNEVIEEPIIQPTPSATEHEAPEYTVTGKTTFQDLLDWGVTQETIEGILGKPMPNAQMAVKDFVTEQGIEFSESKTRLQAALDAAR